MMTDSQREWIRARNELVREIKALGFPEELGSQIAKQLGSPKAMSRMMGYLVNMKPRSAELIVDEMLAICSGPRRPVDVGFGRTVAERRP